MFKRWQDWVMVLMGFWLLVSPTILDYAPSHAINGNAFGTGAVLIAFNLIAAARLVDDGQELFNIMTGWWLIASPFALGFHGSGCAEYNVIGIGSAVIVLAIWEICSAANAPSNSNTP